MLLKLSLPIVIIVVIVTFANAQKFEIDYDHDAFLMNGEPFRYISGSAHYFRMPRQVWRDRLRKMAAAGLNAVSTYVEWYQHEPEPGLYDFSGDLNITEFIETAREEGLYVILRVGPYICAEREMGGFPYWILRQNPDVRLRVNDSSYTRPVENWLNLFLPKISPYLFGNGGPIITVQVENEYGFYGQCDHDYTSWLASVFQRHIGDKAVLFTTDGSSYGSLSCGKIPGVYATVDFGPGANVTEMFLNQKAVEPSGPAVNSEFYPGWLTHWGERWAARDTSGVISTLRDILDAGANVNMYMFYGGTNFGFTAGANYAPYSSDVTSYDYDAPISEAGDITLKYQAIRDLVLQYVDKETQLPANDTKGDYGTVELKPIGRLFAPTVENLLTISRAQSDYPETFEAISHSQGYVLYESAAGKSVQNAELKADVRDLGTVYINKKYVGQLNREKNIQTLNVSVNSGDKISILVENGGRINFGDHNNDRKGILSNVTLDGEVVTRWTSRGIALDNVGSLSSACQSANCLDGEGFTIYAGFFAANTTSYITYNSQQLAADSFLDVSGLRKGLVFVNGINLGRYWSTRGPQYSIYVPGAFLKAPSNTPSNSLWIIEEELTENLNVSFSTSPIIGNPKQFY